MPAARDIPPALTKGPFRCEIAFGLGVTRRQLTGSRFRRIFHRVYVSVDLPDSVELRCRAALLAVPTGAVFCGVTAARLYRVPVPDTADDRVHLALPAGTSTIPQVRGIVTHRYGLTLGQMRKVHDLYVVRPERLFAELAVDLVRLDLIIAGDHLLGKGWIEPDDLRRSIEASTPRPGLRLARAVLPHLEPKTDSPMETRLRMILVDAGLPRPVANADVFDPGGVWIGRPDLSYPALKIALDYEGGHHRTDARQYRNDLTRDDQFAVNGWIHLKYDAATVFQVRHRIVADVREAIALRRQQDGTGSRAL
ncbi:hypothetical protein [Actinomadura alba]|uniref:DUF559 domain-containing protein n=1 Tax=Actinomadura alba TaxID=406431 RepID=A0ABR7LYU9_9ACTN|nr:hypothetical protein [Actinomadura alba]MBC6469956.1 hypothetical protein [Actinomadura alba]